MYQALEFLSTNSIEGNSQAECKIGQVIINTIAKSILDNKEKRDSSITPMKIYQFWTSLASMEAIRITQEDNNKMIAPIFSVTKFELFFHNNPLLARAAMDEMLMCEGHRKLLIWFLTHIMNLSISLVDYVYELVSGLRGTKDITFPYKFSRKGGKVHLSEIEQLMVLHEFLGNSADYLSATDGIDVHDGYRVFLAESIAKKLLSVLCLMINHLIQMGIIDLSGNKSDHLHDYTNELQVLLINWIGKVPEARRLFFKIKNGNTENKKATNSFDTTVSKEDEINLFEKYEKATTEEISTDIAKNLKNKRIIESFAKRIECHLEAVLSQSGEAPKLEEINDDFRYFLTNFNTLCKVDYLAETLFGKFEPVISSGSISKLDATTEIDEGFDAEFNTEFLNGEGRFEKKKQQSHRMVLKRNQKRRKIQKEVDPIFKWFYMCINM